jgi:hypothetical protein
LAKCLAGQGKRGCRAKSNRMKRKKCENLRWGGGRKNIKLTEDYIIT